MKTTVQFINHASVIVSDGSVSVLSDPWFLGEAFHKGWNLLHETDKNEVNLILDKITHIWISHEHPDHFSIAFFKSFSEEIKNKSIKILFQKTKDKRVFNFLTAQGLEVCELEFNKPLILSKNYHVTCIKDGFYDSGLLIKSHGEKILNLNDCEITTPRRADEVFKVTGTVDVLLTQFSFAAWKGGKNNKKWREEAAKEKINTMDLQIKRFEPECVIPFASFIYFSNKANFYLNDAANRLEHLKEKLKEHSSKITIMAPNDVFGGKAQSLDEDNAIKFWRTKYLNIRSKNLNEHDKIDLNSLRISFEKYCKRIKNNNSIFLIKVIRLLSPISAFKPVIIQIDDLSIKVKFDYVTGQFTETQEQAMLSMKSESLDFIFKNSFGFDTLTVNGCFEEEKRNGFVDATKTLAIENLNNLGIKIELKTLVNLSIIKLFLTRLYRVARKLDG
jgi:UDP-MurNAc hydroxylase